MKLYRAFWLASCTLVFLSVFGNTNVSAQDISGETEFGSDGKGHPFFSQYIYMDGQKYNVLVRYFYDRPHVNRGEFAIGPTFHVGESILKLQFGATTNREVMTAGTIQSKVASRAILYIADAKFATVNGEAHTLYQKLFVGLTKSGKWQFRIEDLQVGREQAFVRIGVEWQHNFPRKTQIFLAPFYDPRLKEWDLIPGLDFSKPLAVP